MQISTFALSALKADLQTPDARRGGSAVFYQNTPDVALNA